MNKHVYSRMGFWLLALALLGASATAAARSLPDFTKLVEEHSAAVVNISTTQKHDEKRSRLDPQVPGIPPGVPFDDFLKRFFGDRPPGHDDFGSYESESLGSGFIVSHEGYILTNYHVVNDADEIVVRLSDRREYDAKLVGSDKRSDIALLKIDAKELPVVSIGDSKKVKVGEWVLAIGSPFGFDHTVTAGIVSALGRSLPNENYVPFIQTDVAINPGNSGGPLFNLDGDVIGINSQIYSRTGGFMGLSFAIPIDMAMNIADQLKRDGHVSRGWLGVLIQDVTRELAESFGMKRPIGALVAKILPDSPAARAGFQVGDVIVEYDGREVGSSSLLPPMVGSSPIDGEVPVKVMRNGRTLTLKVVIKELPDDEELQVGSANPREMKIERLDIVVSDLSDAQREYYEDLEQGAVIERVEDGAGAQAGLHKGDVIVKLNNVDVKDVQHLRRIVDDLPGGKSVPILVLRSSGPVFLAMRIPED